MGIVAIALVVVAYLKTQDSAIGSTIFFESLEVSSQIYQILVWSGTDILLYMTMDDVAYQEAQIGFTVVGDGGAAVVVLTWIVCINTVFSPLLFLYSQSHTIEHTLLDLFVETSYGCWAMAVAVQQAQFRALPTAVFVPSTLSGFAMMLFPWFCMLLHMPRQIRDGLVANLILNKLSKIQPGSSDDGKKAEDRVYATDAVEDMLKQEYLTSTPARIVGGSIMVSALVAAAWITAIAVDPTLVSDACGDEGFKSGNTNDFGEKYWLCQTQEYDWRFQGTGGIIKDDAYHQLNEDCVNANGCAFYRGCVAGMTGTNCALEWQYERRRLMNGVIEAKEARAFSLTKGTLCTEPVPYLFDLNGDLPESLFTHYAGVRELHLDATEKLSIDELPRSIGNLLTLEYLSLRSNVLGSVPDSVCDLARLWYVDLAYNQLNALPSCLGDLGDLEVLNLDGNQLVDAAFLPRLPKLRYLYLAQNDLAALPEDIGNLKSLINFQFDNNAIAHVPSSFSNLTDLVNLYGKMNSITGYFPSLRDMPRLKRVDLYGNDLSAVPEGIEFCESLEILRLELNGQISSLPVGLASLPNLRFVGLFGTDLCTSMSIKAGALDPAFDELVAAKKISCCMPEVFYPCTSGRVLLFYLRH